MKEKIYEHLITKGKYNTLKLNYDIKCNDYDRKVIELKVEQQQRKRETDIFDKKLQELLEENMKLKEDLTKTKRDLKELKKNKA